MKKQFVIGIFLMLVLTVVSLMPSSMANGFSVDLIAGHNTDIGEVSVSHDSNYINITYTLYGPWYLLETDTQIGENLNDIPRTKNGNPKPGRFDNKSFFDTGDVQYYKEIIPINGLSGTIIVSCHAVVCNSTSGKIFSAWGDGIRFVERGSFGTYFYYPLS